ncbi:MAG: DUF1638 domain-containing protein, partial [Methanomassiliicoccales archaeon]|nr:DUF1638 domain-containing protein [Methanomassiliicoccales archaeon]
MGKTGAMGILGCTILQEELLYVLSRDEEIRNLVVMEGASGEAFHHRAREVLPVLTHILIPYEHLDDVEACEGLTVIVDIKETSLHRDPKAFREEVRCICRAMRDHVSSILLFFGLCRNALWKMHEFSNELDVPIMILEDREGHEVDDCFGAVMGGKRIYLKHILEHRGTLFIIPGYAEHWARKLGSKDVVKALEAYNDLRFVFERLGYDKVLRIDTHLGDQDDFEKKV